MRVISGKCKGRTLKAVPGLTTRPTTDKVKESLFNIIGPYFKGGQALDLFAGSGGLGIEALSRGVEKVIFVDRDPKAVAIIKSNIRSCNFDDQAEVYINDATRALKVIVKREMKFDLIFLDPPYAKQKLKEQISYIAKCDLLNENGIIVAEHDAAYTFSNEIETLTCFRREQYGDIAISFYQKVE